MRSVADMEIVAHRGIPTDAAENTVAAFERAVELGADAVELDVRLTADRVPVIFHYYYLDGFSTGHGPIFAATAAQLREVRVPHPTDPAEPPCPIPTLEEVLERFAGRIGLEIEIKGPEPEAPEIIGAVLQRYRQHWDRIEVTSYEPALLLAIGTICPGLPADLLMPRSESWMGLDVVGYQALQRGRLAHARAIHLHPTQLSPGVVAILRSQGMEIHSWSVNDEESLALTAALGLRRICTDDFERALGFRHRIAGAAPR